MTAPDPADQAGPDLAVSDEDALMALLADARQALDALGRGFHRASCRDHHPNPGQNADRLGLALHHTYGLDALDADFLLAQTADVRREMQRVLIAPCHHHDTEEGDES